MDSVPISQREISGKEDEIDQNRGYLPGETGRRLSKKNEKKNWGYARANKSGETGKRHEFLKVVTVNRSGETGRRFWQIFFREIFGRNRETQ